MNTQIDITKPVIANGVNYPEMVTVFENGRRAVNLNHPMTARRYGFKTNKYGGRLSGTGSYLVYKSKIVPGVYINDAGYLAPDAIAEASGFDVQADRLEGERQARISTMQKEINSEFSYQASRQMTIAEAGEFKLVDAGFGRTHIVDGSGHKVTPKPITEEQGRKYLAALTGNANV